MFEGLNTQLYNISIDLYIEDYLFNNYPELRPVQFLSLLEMYKESSGGINHPDKEEYIPFIVSEANTIMVLLNLYQFKELFGVDLVKDLKLSNPSSI